MAVSYNTATEVATKQALRAEVLGGASTHGENLTAAELAGQSANLDVTYPETYQEGIGATPPTWVDDAIAHVSVSDAANPVGTRVQVRQVSTNQTETQVLPVTSPYTSQTQTRQYNTSLLGN